MNSIQCPDLQSKHIILEHFPLPKDKISRLICEENWGELDNFFKEQVAPSGALFSFIKSKLHFQSLEFIIAIREAPEDEEGIWHDDGSRLLGFSLSLNLCPEEISGGELHFRPKENKEALTQLKTQSFGTMILFKTGLNGFEHKVTQVTSGRRIVVAGWCYP